MLKGPRVELKAINREDLPRIYEFNNDLETELLGGGSPPLPMPLLYWENRFEQRAKERPENISFAIWADGKIIGDVGLKEFDRTGHKCELGISIGDKEYWGKGYGRETIGLVLDYAFRILNQQRVWLSTNGNNERAIRCYRACGFVEEGRLRRHVWNNGRYVDFICMGILREEWEG